MDKTVVGLFETRANAEAAVQEMIQQGCPRECVRIEDGDSLYGLMGTEPRNDRGDGREEGFMSGIRNFFEDIGFVDPDGSRPGELGRSGTTREVSALQPGEVLVVVDVDDKLIDSAVEILNKHGAIEMDTRHSSVMNDSEANYTGGKTHAERARVTTTKAASSTNPGSGQTTIPVMEEELEVGKRVETRGGVRIYTRIVERPVEKDISLKEETVHVDRHAVNRPISENEFNAFKEGTIEVKETAEKAVIAKRARVKEEITVSKETKEHSEKIRDTLRNTEVDVSQLDVSDHSKLAEYESEFRKNFEKTFAPRGMNYEEVLPIYKYGYQLGKNPKYHNGDWSIVESQIRRDWDQQHYGPWDSLKDAVRVGWERAVRR